MRSIALLTALALAPSVALAEPETGEAVEGPPAPEGFTEDPITPAQRARFRTMRRSGLALMASGGGLALGGFGLTLAFTMLGDTAEAAEQPSPELVERRAAWARGGGALLVSGLATVAVGGVVLGVGKRQQAEARAGARAQLRLAPTLGGVAVSGRF